MPETEFVDVYPDQVIRAGRQTEGTEQLWRSWGSRIRLSFQHADSGLQSPKIFESLQTYASGVVGSATRVGQRVANLGVNTTTAGAVVGNADEDSLVVVNHQVDLAAAQGSVLNRPVNGGPVAV